MSRNERRGWWTKAGGSLVALTVVLGVGAASAQVKRPEIVRDDAQLFHPTTDPSRFVTVYDTRNLDPGRYTLGLYGNYAQDPIVLHLDDADRDAGTVVKRAAGAELVGAIGVTNWFTLGVGVPYIYTDTNPLLSLGQEIDDGGHFLGDVSLEGKLTLVERPPGQGWGFSLLPRIILPTGDLDGYAGTGEIGGGGLAILDARHRKINYGLNVGYLIRDGFGSADGGDDELDDQMLFGAGITVPTTRYLDLIAEVTGRSALSDVRNTPVEGIGALRFHWGNIAITVGGGAGITRGRGAPEFRVFGSVTPYIREREIAPPHSDLLTNSRKTWALAVDAANDGRANPGDTLEYSIHLMNTGTADAEEVVFVDPIPENTAFVAGSMTLNGQPLSDAADEDAGDVDASNPGAVTVKLGTVPKDPPGNAVTFTFRVLINREIVDLTIIRNEAQVFQKNLLYGSEEAEAVAETEALAAAGPVLRELLPTVETTAFPRIRERETVVVTPDKLELTRNIHFEFDKAIIRTESYSILDDVAAVLGDNPELNILIEGHTDGVGAADYNQKLSDRRAAAVRQYLIGKGVAGTRLATDGKGELAPIASNDTPVGRAMNRRVEFLVVNPDVLRGRAVEKRPNIEDISPESEPTGVAPGGGRRGDTEVIEAQEALRRIGFLSDEPTGIMDDRTRAALQRFQKENGLPVTGAPDAVTRKALDEAIELSRTR